MLRIKDLVQLIRFFGHHVAEPARFDWRNC